MTWTPEVPTAVRPAVRGGVLGLAARHKVWAALGAVLVLGLVGQAASAISGTPADSAGQGPVPAASASPSPAAQVALLDVADYVSAGDCANVEKVLASSRTASATLRKQATYSNAYDAQATVARHGLTALDAVQVDNLNRDLTEALAPAIERTKAAGPYSTLRAESQALRGCKLTAAEKKARTAATNADDAVETIVERAEDVPWYPKGFAPYYGDSDIAFQWVKDPDCDYFGCMQARVVVNQFCGSLYVELTTKNAAGENIGFTNDVLTALTPGDRGLLTFTITDDDVRHGSITEVNCY